MLVRTLWFYLALCCVQRVVEAAEGCGEETVMWTDRLDDFHLKTFYLCCLHLRQPPEAESKSIIKSVPRWFQSFKPAQTVCFVVNNKPRLLPALCSLWVQRGSRVPLCRFRRAFPRRGAARRGAGAAAAASLLCPSLVNPHFTRYSPVEGSPRWCRVF